MADQNENPNKPDSEIRIGVYTCHCGGNIGKVVACEKVAKILEKLDNVAVSRTDLSFCSDAGQAIIEKISGKMGSTAWSSVPALPLCMSRLFARPSPGQG